MNKKTLKYIQFQLDSYTFLYYFYFFFKSKTQFIFTNNFKCEI